MNAKVCAMMNAGVGRQGGREVCAMMGVEVCAKVCNDRRMLASGVGAAYVEGAFLASVARVER
jgi:hypothetical protein